MALGPIGIAAAALGGTAFAAAGGFGSDVVALRDKKDIARYRLPDGRAPQADVVYAEHPRRERLLVPLSDLRTFLLREQVADMVAYCRSMLRLSELELAIHQADGAAVSMLGIVEGLPLAADCHVERTRDAYVRMSFASPQEPTRAAPGLTWIADFPQVRAAVEGARAGRLTVHEAVGLGLGLEASAPRIARVSANLFARNTFSLTVAFG